MTATAQPPASPVEGAPQGALNRAEGVELLGPVHGCGYRDGAALVRRADGQMVQLGGLMYALLEAVDGQRDNAAVAAVMSEELGRRVEPEHVVRLAEKLSRQGLLAGTEHQAPPRRNPLLALRWKVLVTNTDVTRRVTTPFSFLFAPWIMWPVLACFGGVFWFVLIHKGVASATSQAFNSPGLLLLVFVLAVVSAGFHELGHAAACRYGGATPGGMGMGLYLVWPAFYTDVTDTYRLPKRARLRVDLAGLYFNAVVAVLTLGVWLVWRKDALLLLVALQILQMVKQLSPVIRADGYHILSDATGVPDLYAHMGPTMRRLLPRHWKEPSALNGRARLLVTVWVLIVVPVLISLSLSAIVLLPRLATSAWDSGHHIVTAIPHQSVLGILASILRLLALLVPVAGSIMVTQKIVRTTVAKALSWSRGSHIKHAAVAAAALAIAAGMAWAWWPAGQYQPVRADQGGTIEGVARLVAAPEAVARPAAAPAVAAAPVRVASGTHLAVAMLPVGGATARHPALFVIPGGKGKPAVAIVSTQTPAPPPGAASTAATTSTTSSAAPSTATASSTTATTPTTSTPTSSTAPAAAFPFKLPAAPGPGGTQALAVNTTNGGVTYDVAYTLVTVSNGAPVTETNSAYAIAHCQSCTTVAVSFQVVLVIGQSKDIAPINAAGSLNYDCPACTTTAIADQIVVTLKSQPSQALLAKLEADLKQLGALPNLGANGTPAAIASQVAAVQQEIDSQLNASGLKTVPATSASSTTASATSSSSHTATSASSTTPAATTSTPGSSGAPSSTGAGSSAPAGGSSSGGSAPSTGTATAPATSSAPSAGASPGAETATTSATTTATTVNQTTATNPG